MQVAVALVLLIGSLAIGVVNGHELPLKSVCALAAEEGRARASRIVFVDDPAAQICWPAIGPEKKVGTTDIGSTDQDLIGRPDIISSRGDESVGRQLRQIGAVKLRKYVKIYGAARHSACTRTGVDNPELSVQRLLVGSASAVQIEQPDGMNGHKRPVGGDKFLASELYLLLNEPRRFGCEAGLFASSQPQNESERRYSERSERSDGLLVGVKERPFTDDEPASAFLLRIGGFVICGILLAVSIALSIRGREFREAKRPYGRKDKYGNSHM
jgi:hypothetical protein